MRRCERPCSRWSRQYRCAYFSRGVQLRGVAARLRPCPCHRVDRARQDTTAEQGHEPSAHRSELLDSRIVQLTASAAEVRAATDNSLVDVDRG